MKNKLSAGMDAPDFKFNTPWRQGLAFHDGFKDGLALLVFLRYLGCPLCQLKIDEILAEEFRFQDAGISLFVVLQSSSASVRGYYRETDIPFSLICDPEGKIYECYGVVTGSIFRYITPGVLKKVASAKKHGIRHGKKEGKELQLPAIFIISSGGRIAYAGYGKNIGDVPENEALFEMIANMKDRR